MAQLSTFLILLFLTVFVGSGAMAQNAECDAAYPQASFDNGGVDFTPVVPDSDMDEGLLYVAPKLSVQSQFMQPVLQSTDPQGIAYFSFSSRAPPSAS
jgi:hypothetical protein